jgi:hypothetical protein
LKRPAPGLPLCVQDLQERFTALYRAEQSVQSTAHWNNDEGEAFWSVHFFPTTGSDLIPRPQVESILPLLTDWKFRVHHTEHGKNRHTFIKAIRTHNEDFEVWITLWHQPGKTKRPRPGPEPGPETPTFWTRLLTDADVFSD